MPRKCPPGVFCIENMTIVFLFLLLFIIGMFTLHVLGNQVNPSTSNKDQIMIMERSSISSPYFTKPTSIMSSLQDDILLNPYVPPLKQNPYFDMAVKRNEYGGGNINYGKGIPINMQTSHYDLDYKQVGILTRENGPETILPVFGRPLHSNRNKWQYYTMTDKNNMIKLPLSKGGRSCTDEYGCDEIYNGDNVFVEGYNDSFKATVYENSYPRYIPYI
jgi:hypothetical protein